MTTTTIRVSEPRELLALVPHQLGFHPHESAVVVSLRVPRGRVGLVARVDLADLGDPRSGPQLARTLVTHLANDGADRAVLVLYTDQDPRRPGGGLARAADAHLQEAADPYLRDVATWVVGPRGYFSLGCEDEECCPPGGRALSELESTAVGAHLVLTGSAVVGSRDDLATIVPAEALARRRAGAARARAVRRWAQARTDGPVATMRERQDALAAWRAEVTAGWGQEPGVLPARIGRIEAGLEDVRVRDAVLVSLVPGTGDLAERTLLVVSPNRGGAGGADGAAGGQDDAGLDAAVSRAVAVIVDPVDGVTPPDAATAVHRRALEAIVAHGRRGQQAPALTLLALLAWWEADGARAGVLLERALQHRPGYRLAVLLEQALESGLPPGWVRRQS